MRLIACMLNYRPWRVFSPAAVALGPRRGTCQRNVNLLRFVPMTGVVGFRSKEQEAAGDPFAGEWATETYDLTPAVVLQEACTDFGCRVSVTPRHRRGGTTEVVDQLAAEGRRISFHFSQPTQNGEYLGHNRSALIRGRPVREERRQHGGAQGVQQRVSPVDEIPRDSHECRCRTAGQEAAPRFTAHGGNRAAAPHASQAIES